MNSEGAGGHRPWCGARIIAPPLLISIAALAACGRSTPGPAASTPHAAAVAVVPMTCPQDAMATTRPDGTTRLAYSGHAVTCVVGSAGVYRVMAYGANGGGAVGNAAYGKDYPADTHPGNGAEVHGDVALAAGANITVLVGGAGLSAQFKYANEVGGAGGGGGGSFVTEGQRVLAVAGGGGGAGESADGVPGSDLPAAATTRGKRPTMAAGMAAPTPPTGVAVAVVA